MGMRTGILLAAALSLLVACGGGQNVMERDATVYRFGTAMRWGAIEQAWAFVDPAFREQSPLTALDLERFAQVEIKGYRLAGSSLGPDGELVRDVEINLVNRHTMRERTVQHREIWRWDPDDKRWWLSNGLPRITGD